MTEFQEKVRKVVKSIPEGTTLTYKKVAEKAGRPRAYRAVASVMAQNFDPQVPCHRVIKTDGSVGEYNRGGETRKRELLQAEGLAI